MLIGQRRGIERGRNLHLGVAFYHLHAHFDLDLSFGRKDLAGSTVVL
jgi:hypothetical protein